MRAVRPRALAIHAPPSLSEASVFPDIRELATSNADVVYAQQLFEAENNLRPLSDETLGALQALAVLQFERGDLSPLRGQNASLRARYPALQGCLSAEEAYRLHLQKLIDPLPVGLGLLNTDEEVLDVSLSLARCLQAQGRFADAYPFFSVIRWGALINTPLLLADASHNAAACLLDRDIAAGTPTATIVQAYNFFAAAFSNKRVLLGDAHPSTLRSRLGLLQCRLIDPNATGPRPGDPANLRDAVLESRSALTAAVGALGYANRDVLLFFETRAQLLASAGDYVGAEAPLRARLAVAQEAFGALTDVALGAMDDLAECLLEIGGAANVSEAEKLYSDCLHMRRERGGGVAPPPPTPPAWLAWCPPALLALWPLSLLVPAPPPGTLTTGEAETAMGKAWALSAGGKFGEAGECMQRLSDRALTTPDPAALVAIQANLGAVELGRGDAAKAVTLFIAAATRAAAFAAAIPPPNRALFATQELTDSILLDIRTNLALAYQTSSNFALAIFHFDAVRAARGLILAAKPEPHREHAAARDAVIDVALKTARCFVARGAVGPPDDIETAFDRFEDAYDLQMNELGPAHKSTRETALEIANFLRGPHAGRLPQLVAARAVEFLTVARIDRTRPDVSLVTAMDQYSQLLKSGEYAAAEAGFGALAQSFTVMLGEYDPVTVLAVHYQNRALLGIADKSKGDSGVALRATVNARLQRLAQNEGFCDDLGHGGPHEWNAHLTRCINHRGMLSALLASLPAAEFSDVVDVCRASVAAHPGDPFRHLNLGIVLMELNEDDSALGMLNAAIGAVPIAPIFPAAAVAAAARLLPDDLKRLCSTALAARGRLYFKVGKLGGAVPHLPFNTAAEEYEHAFLLQSSLLPPNIVHDFVQPRAIAARPLALPPSRFTPAVLNAMTAEERADLTFLISIVQRLAFALEKSVPAAPTPADLLLRTALNVSSDILRANFDADTASLHGALDDLRALYDHRREQATDAETRARNEAAPLLDTRDAMGVPKPDAVARADRNAAAVMINRGAADAAAWRASARALYDEHLEAMLCAARRTLGDAHSSTVRVARELIAFLKGEGREQEAWAVRPRVE